MHALPRAAVSDPRRDTFFAFLCGPLRSSVPLR